MVRVVGVGRLQKKAVAVMALLLNAQEVELLSALNEHGVRYIVVGGHAVVHYGHLRATKDLDLWIEATPENAERIAHALEGLRFVLNPEQVKRLARPMLQMRLNTLHTELLSDIAGLEFSEAMRQSVTAIEGGVQCHVLGLDDLIANKKLIGRDSDLQDVAALESARANAG